ncbi:MAG: ABC transporter permease [Candidatus Altiarchaeota archaeon]|nr:ABC transporter permease [Candidatus Altiarchaeota archaeon]MBU4406554.1 ABC transporter permease [Candidatus Altiarchaeota archaeon]MBU4437325.1 ABC transporter permease [Candidatus Altiarchaeota archaeon]
MKLKDIALDNLKRRKSKMAFLIIGMVIGIATVVTIFTITQAMQEDVQKKLDEFGANIMIVPKANTLSMSYGGMSIPGAQYDLREIQEKEIDNIWTIENEENLATVSPKLLGAVDIEGETVLIVGADLATEIKLKKWWKFTNGSDLELTRVEKPSPIDPTKTMTVTKIKGLKEDDVIIGSNVAEKLNKKPADSITLDSDGNTTEVNIKAVIQETGSQDDSIIFMNLETAQKLLGKEGKITLVEVAAICSGCPVEEMARQINEAIPNGKATPIKQVVAQKMQTINQLSSFGLAVGVIVLLIGSLIVFTTMMSSVNERTREIGIFRAIGFRRIHVVKIILMEALILSSIAGIIGYALGLAATLIAGPAIAGMEVSIPFDPYMAGGSLALAVFVGAIATIYPALRASRIDPAEALRHI